MRKLLKVGRVGSEILLNLHMLFLWILSHSLFPIRLIADLSMSKGTKITFLSRVSRVYLFLLEVKKFLVNDLRILKENFSCSCRKNHLQSNRKGSRKYSLMHVLITRFLVNMLIVHSPSGFSSVPQVESPAMVFFAV